ALDFRRSVRQPLPHGRGSARVRTFFPAPTLRGRFSLWYPCLRGRVSGSRRLLIPPTLSVCEGLMACKIRPPHDRVIVQRLEGEEKTASGLIIPDSAKEKPQHGKVIRTGKGRLLDDGTIAPLDVKDGDKILFGKYSGSDVKIDGEEYLILREDDILAVLGD